MNKVVRRSLLIASFLSLAVVGVAQANPIISFADNGFTSSTMSYNGTGGSFNASNIAFLSVSGDDTPLNDGAGLNCDCSLHFSTGKYVSDRYGIYKFNGGGSFTLTGTAKQKDGSAIANGTLLSGRFEGEQSIVKTAYSGNFNGGGSGILNPDLLRYFGIGANVNSSFSVRSNFGISRNKRNGGFKGQVFSADIQANATAVPEPSNLFMLGAGFLGLTFLARKKSRKRQ